jgi:hypothetical protein
MANTIRLNAASLNRPGVFVTQTSSGGVPEPIANHAVGYIFGTTPTEDYYGDNAVGSFSEYVPYVPTQIASVQDYLEKIGGSVPVGNKGALATYDAIKAYFDNVGVNGILYFTRVTPTPETVIDLSASSAGAGYNAFALKVNGRYYGTPIGINDNEGTEIKVITTTALDQVDNARDLYSFLSSDSGDGFSSYYRVEQSDNEALLGKFRIFSRDSRSLPKVDKFIAYQFNDTLYANPLDLNNEIIIKFYTSVKEINFRCTSRDQSTGEPILFVSGSAISEFIEAVNTDTPGTYNVSTDQSTIIKDFLVNQGIYASETNIPDDKIVAISKDLTSGVASLNKWEDTSAAYWRYDLAGTAFAKIQSGGIDVVPSGSISQTGDIETRTGYLPDSVQVFYVNVAGENRAIILNGSTPDDLTTNLVGEINTILAEKGLDGFYSVEVVDSGTNISGNTHVPNNGHVISELVSEAGAPYIRPELGDIALSGTITISAGTVSGTNTSFTTELAVGDTIVANGVRFVVASITNDTAATVTPNNVTIASPTSFSLDKSIPNGFYSHDYVIKVKITSNNGVSSPINTGFNRLGVSDSNVIKLVSKDQNSGYESYKISTTAKVNDFVYAIETGMESRALQPGFVFAPEAYTVVSYEVGGDLASKLEARSERLKITQSLVKVAEGRVGQTEGITGTQHIALIDCGADEESLSDVRDELDFIKSTVGVPFGHASFYAPYVKNIDGRYIAPSSFQAGIACSRYINEGFQQPPAGSRYPLRGATGLKFEISAQQQEVTYALGLNPVRSLPNRGIVVWGSRTLASNPLFKFVNTRAILNVLIDVLGRSFDDILFEKIDSAGTVFARVKSIASQVLGQFYRAGALYGNRPEQAYLVVCSSANNSDIDFENGTVRLDVFVATSPTLERLPITIIRTPTGQVAQISDSFSRNEERFSYLLDTTSSII